MTDTKEFHNIIREYFKTLYSVKLEYLKGMDDFLGSAKLSKLNQKEVNNLNWSIKMRKFK